MHAYSGVGALPEGNKYACLQYEKESKTITIKFKGAQGNISESMTMSFVFYVKGYLYHYMFQYPNVLAAY